MNYKALAVFALAALTLPVVTPVTFKAPLIPAPAGRQIGKGEDKMALPEKEVLDSLAARYERIYLRELAKCGSKGNYRNWRRR